MAVANTVAWRTDLRLQRGLILSPAAGLWSKQASQAFLIFGG